jgi:hypothetical protein
MRFNTIDPSSIESKPRTQTWNLTIVGIPNYKNVENMDQLQIPQTSSIRVV